MAYSKPSVILPTIQNLIEWLIHQIDVLLFRRTSKGWRNGLKVLEISNSKGHVLTMGRNNPNTSACPIWKAVWQGMSWIYRWTQIWTLVCRLPLQPRRLNVTWAALGKSVDSRSREVILFLYSGKTNLKCWVQHWALQDEGDVNILEWVQWRGSRTGASGIKEELWLVSLEKRMLRGIIFPGGE